MHLIFSYAISSIQFMQFLRIYYFVHSEMPCTKTKNDRETNCNLCETSTVKHENNFLNEGLFRMRTNL